MTVFRREITKLIGVDRIPGVGLLTSPKTYTALAVFHVADAAACAAQVPPIKKSLDTVGCPESVRPILPVVKVTAAVGLLSARWFPRLARLTTAMLTLYFTLAVGAHVRVRDSVANTVPAAAFLTLFATMTAKGPRPGERQSLTR